MHRLSRSRLSHRTRLRVWSLVSVGIALGVAAWYLYGTRRCGDAGFPLDDAWIHQTYARSLARAGRLTYTSGQISLGSTSPLWTLLLSIGHLWRIPPLPWAYALGISSWLFLAWVSASLAHRLFPRGRGVALLVGLACLAEWHLAWAALSGLEIVLFGSLSLLLIERYAARTRPVWLGLIGGLLIWVRPEGIVLTSLLIGVVAVEGLLSWRRRGDCSGMYKSLVGLVIGCAVLWLPYAVLNMAASGRLFPNTFYAKQAEYGVLLARPIWVRLWDVAQQPWIGGQVLLIPGFVWQVYAGLRHAVDIVRPPATGEEKTSRAGLACLVTAWWVAHHLVYALRLPVGYQHGRYMMPCIPILLVYGIVGTARLVGCLGITPRAVSVARMASPRRVVVARVLRRTLVLALCGLFVGFVILGGRAFAKDVCTIQCEMVGAALWLRTHTQPTALVAAHDIGAIGYWSDRSLIDLAGLITPEVIPFIRDEERLLAFLLAEGADYVATFPSWYPEMVADDRLVRVHQRECPVTWSQGGDNMAVYRIRQRSR